MTVPTEKQIEVATKVYIGNADITEAEARPEVIRILSAALAVEAGKDGDWRTVPVELPDDVIEAVEDDMYERRSCGMRIYASDVWAKALEELALATSPEKG